jgi:hypothetical protein
MTTLLCWLLLIGSAHAATLACHALATAWGLEPPGEYDLYQDEAC